MGDERVGMDFCALVKLEEPRRKIHKGLPHIMAGQIPELAAARRLYEEQGMFGYRLKQSTWKIREKWDLGRKVPTPENLPDLMYELLLPEEFDLAFSGTALRIYFALRWLTFLEQQEWQETLVTACRKIAVLFEAEEGVITRDESPVIEAFRTGTTSYDECLAAATGRDGEVASIADLYEEVVYEGMETWDSHGYWRFWPVHDQ